MLLVQVEDHLGIGSGAEAVAPFEGAFLPPSRRPAYPIRDGIPNFLLEERLELSEPLP